VLQTGNAAQRSMIAVRRWHSWPDTEIRARDQLKAFASERGLSVAACYVENESGAKLSRPELFRLLNDAQPGDILLVEQVDRLSRLTSADWEKLNLPVDPLPSYLPHGTGRFAAAKSQIYDKPKFVGLLPY
jgi:Resolvase, N terminal domain